MENLTDKTRIALIALIITLLSFSCTNSKRSKSNEVLPNIVLLMGDDHGWDEVGYNGHPYVKTPTLDEMANSGLRFDRFYSAHPTCSPTRGSLLTGRHPNRYGTFGPNWSLRPEEFTIAQLLKDAGYTTAHFGKWHVGPIKKESPTSPGAMGFDEWLSHDNFFEIDPVLSRNGETPQIIKGESSEILIDEAIEFIKKSKAQNKPFLTVVWFGSPHEPYKALPEDMALYNNLPDSLNNRKVRITSLETGKGVSRPLGDVLQERYAEITAMDRAIGKLRTYLEKNNLKENTMFMYVGDNGTPGSAGHAYMTLRESKGTMYEGGIRVPGVMEWPAVIKQPVSTSAISVTTDYMQTLADITGQPLPDRPLDGKSWVPLFKDPSIERNQPHFFWQFNRDLFEDDCEPYIEVELQEGTTPLSKMMDGKYTRTFRNCKYSIISEKDFQGARVIMKDRYKLIVEGDTPNENGYELYDIQNDPAETTNLADEFPEMVKEMAAHLHKWQESVLTSLTGADYKSDLK
ncbi:sulfatase [Marinilabilia salmonicolor]|uniref:Arylsulfatase A-like enzyme n=1 Tax=Marinilabilia salmonicolor TaxID=989 RepID=A0A368V6T2_9BACT|nr:sulfatase-like hydrolase/transferase [Marinilabilia salmonicolor]RCW36818.1 arylsulfatase A-like enzyme [Marinilabilia salmonicolor]